MHEIMTKLLLILYFLHAGFLFQYSLKSLVMKLMTQASKAKYSPMKKGGCNVLAQ